MPTDDLLPCVNYSFHTELNHLTELKGDDICQFDAGTSFTVLEAADLKLFHQLSNLDLAGRVDGSSAWKVMHALDRRGRKIGFLVLAMTLRLFLYGLYIFFGPLFSLSLSKTYFFFQAFVSRTCAGKSMKDYQLRDEYCNAPHSLCLLARLIEVPPSAEKSIRTCVKLALICMKTLKQKKGGREMYSAELRFKQGC